MEPELGQRGSVRALLFDLGGVVLEVDFDRAFCCWAAHAAVSSDSLRARFVFDDFYAQHERGEIDAAAYFASLRQSLGISISDAHFLEGWTGIHTHAVPGVHALLEAAAKKYPIYAFTNSNPSHHRVATTRFTRELSVFEEVFVSSDLGLRKPDVHAYEAVANRMGLTCADVVFFDDSPANVAGAERAGMQAVCVRSIDDTRGALRALDVGVAG